VVIHGDEIDEESSAANHERQHKSAEDHLFDPHASTHPRVQSATRVTIDGRCGGIYKYRR